MTKRNVWMLCAGLGLGIGCGQVEEEAPVPFGDPALHSQEETMASLAARYQWECYPERYGFTPPREVVRFPAEHEPQGELLMSWNQPGCGHPEQLALIFAALEGRVPIHIVAAAPLHSGIIQCLSQAGMTRAQIWELGLVPFRVDTEWIRDHGPDAVVGADGKRRFVDTVLRPMQAVQCSSFDFYERSDRIPTVLGEWWGVPVDRPAVVLSGGNLLTDGAGRCFRARRETNARNCFPVWCYSEEETDEAIGRAHGCDVVTLESLEGGVVDHIDMWMAMLSSKTVLVGRYDVHDDAINAAILDRNARRLADLGYDVVRIPMPTPYCQDAGDSCLGDPGRVRECDGTNTRVWATYLNSIRLGDVMAVPVYRWVPGSLAYRHQRQEQEALATYQWALDREFGPGAVKVHPIPSDTVIPCQGALHRLTKTLR
ncbi:hypothetical protein D7Y13_05765 [Corallococcus praedator]|uniref:Agmatine deiminase family protein n=1 Tax=Corallococcus praedator TaxID=2316724 RepID=A0ABX9QNG0_9BACT|nr:MULTISPECIES: agmatine deiminase family protein [Corallococcus]RKH18776.1 hypothetical protein D7X74_08780 [Corallococcus sp. CA047B]RKH34706.1 hypothetical protein D7X75_07130 [Corallococcus sp. CA031C]RKI14601.1 hypothetical protein D7Y13_05765 [Corallococcus praedator]